MKAVAIESVHEDYAALAENYDQRWQGFNDSVYQWVLARLPAGIREGTVLDLGCGTGGMLRAIHEQHPKLKLTGVDVSPEMMQRAQRVIPAAHFIEDNIENLDLGVFNIILSLNVLHHLNDPVAHLRCLKKSCTADGVIYLCDFSIDTVRLEFMEKWWRMARPSHHGAFSSQKLRQIIEAVGLEIRGSAILTPDSFWRLQIYQLAS